jgi:hypothetical protein
LPCFAGKTIIPAPFMFETAGNLAIAVPVLTLVGLVLLPLLWALAAALSPRRLAKPTAVLGSIATLGLVVSLSVRLARVSAGHVLVQHVAQLARLGQLDLTVDLALDARGAAFAVVIAVVACGSAAFTSLYREAPASRLGWTGIVAAGAMLVCTGDGLAPISIGLGLLSLGSWGLHRGTEARGSVVAFAGNVSILLGFVFLFWALGGSFGPEGYDPDGAPRFALVTTNTPSVAPDKATLSMTTYAGALVSADDADLPNEPIVSPMSVVVPAGVYTLRIQRGGASSDVVVPRVALVAGRTHVLSPYGPTTSLRTLDDQLAAPRNSPAGGITSVRSVLAGRTVAGLRASAVVLLLVLGGALFHLFALAGQRGPSALAGVLQALVAPYFALRLAPLVEPTGADDSLVVLLGGAVGLVLAARASGVDDPSKALRGVAAASAAAAVAAAGLGAPSGVLLLVCPSVVAASAGLAAVEAESDPRWLGVASAAAIGLLPGSGASCGLIVTVSAALASAAKGTVVWAVFSAGLALVLAAVAALASLAAFRPFEEATASKRSGGAAVVVVLASVALLSGVVLGVGTTSFGGHVAPLVERVTGAPAVTATRGMVVAAVMLTIVATASGAAASRRVRAGAAAPGWLVTLGRPYAVVLSAASGIGEGARFLERSVRAMDREVIAYLPETAVGVVERAVQGIGRGGRRLETDAAELDDTRRAERFHTAAVAMMVALLGLVVLSSLFLR